MSAFNLLLFIGRIAAKTSAAAVLRSRDYVGTTHCRCSKQKSVVVRVELYQFPQS